MIKSTLSFLCLLAVTLLGGCNLGGDSSAQEDTPVGSVSFYHACPDCPAMSIVIDGITANTSSFSYGTFTGYGLVNEGKKVIKLNSAVTGNKLIDTTFTVFEKSTYSIFVVNSLAHVKALITSDIGGLAVSSNCKIRFIHLSPDTEPVNASLVGSSPGNYGGMYYQDVADFVELEAKPYTLEVRAASDNRLLVSQSQLVLPEAGKYYTIILAGYSTPPSGNTNTLTAKFIQN